MYLPSICGNTPRTIDSYRYAFIHYLRYLETQGIISANEVELKDFNVISVSGYLVWLQKTKNNSVTTRNHRQAALNSFVKYLMYEIPEYLNEFQQILCIPVKKTAIKEISYLKTDGVKLFFAQVNNKTKIGLRDYTMLAIMYSTGIRVSELIGLRVKDVSLFEPPTLLVHGKGQKSRYVPLINNVKEIVSEYIKSNYLDEERYQSEWLFKSHMNLQFTRQGVNYIVRKYADKARKINPKLIPTDFSPHKLRHTTAMELVDAGVDLIYIRDLLGHVSVKTTEVYAKAQSEKKRKAIEAASKDIVGKEIAQWDEDTRLIEWLKKFNR
ncbi:MAG: tyrosine-type recombinase/integrase [Paludibacter sp.]|nr:tyrosine-type recombinase/integrase [Paludibacter sp.]